ncbi:hypothetical protein SISSUDRAFT_1121656 [Sistotremastrum suecicum HHB10207 ss-3]|uniref:F-box domain-containing protein n=1 Tax=Sistotremastrum suecicum HHB10207 ss-3 TaxID=1314776 RepID=A0A166AI88_9AGAM|nr:hypothetical protein SISSUDRAFT_1121656 [Sistotremastrum suecicum HHB10207 ss-3]
MSGVDRVKPDVPARLGDLPKFCEKLKTMLANSIHVQTHDLDDLDEAARVARETFEFVDLRIGRAIQIVKTNFNRRAPVERLHDELILEILKYCVPLKEKKLPSAFAVCARWRHMANSSPALWTKMYLPMPPEWYSIFVKRSGNSLLEVHLSNWKIQDNQSSCQLLGENLRQLAPRIANLHMFWVPSFDHHGLDKFLASHATDLEFPALEIAEFRESSPRDKPTIVLRTPALRKLTMDMNTNFAPDVITDNVTDLKIRSSSQKSHEIIPLLAGFPQLEHCDIFTYSFDRTSSILPPPSIISLKKLQNISVKTLNVSSATYTLNCLDVPKSARIELEVTDKEDESVGPLIGPRMLTCDELNIGGGGYRKVVLTLKSDSQPSLQISANHFNSALLSELASYPSSLSHFRFKYHALPSSDHLTQALTFWSSLTSICIWTCEPDFDRFLAVLSTDQTPLICPQLESLECTEIKFTRSRMLAFLELRKVRGVPLRELKTTRGFSNPDTEGFAKLVESHVEVDAEPSAMELFFKVFPGLRGVWEGQGPGEVDEPDDHELHEAGTE